MITGHAYQFLFLADIQIYWCLVMGSDLPSWLSEPLWTLPRVLGSRRAMILGTLCPEPPGSDCSRGSAALETLAEDKSLQILHPSENGLSSMLSEKDMCVFLARRGPLGKDGVRVRLNLRGHG